MPVTPFHLGPAIAVYPWVGRRMSLGAFLCVNCAIDVEPVARILMHAHPVHATLHTFLGAMGLALVLIAPARLGLAWLYAHAGPWLAARPEYVLRAWGETLGPVSWAAAAVGSLMGAASHVLLDAVIHPDLRPFAPWSDVNPFLVDASFGAVHVACAMVGLAGLLWLALRLPRPPRVPPG